MTIFSVPCDQASGERSETSIGPTVAASRPLGLLRARNLADGAAEVAGVAEVDGRDGGEGAGNDLFGIDLGAESETHENGQLGARVESAHVFSGIGLGVAFGLRLGQHLCVLGAFLHLAEDEVAGAVENAFDALDAVACHALFEAGNHGNSAGYSSAVFQMAALGSGKPLQIDALIGDELLVGGDDALARFERAAHPEPAGSRPPTSSTITSTSEASTASASSLQTTLAGAQSTRLRATPRLKMWVNSRPCGLDSTRIRATELPTVPKPKMAMRSWRAKRGLREGAAETSSGDAEPCTAGT